MTNKILIVYALTPSYTRIIRDFTLDALNSVLYNEDPPTTAYLFNENKGFITLFEDKFSVVKDEIAAFCFGACWNINRNVMCFEEFIPVNVKKDGRIKADKLAADFDFEKHICAKMY